MIRINSSSICLKAFTKRDVTKEYLSWLKDKETTQFLDIQYKFITKKYVNNFLNNINQKKHFFFLILDKKNNEKIGTIRSEIDIHNVADLGIMIGNKRYLGTNAGYEACVSLLDFLFYEKKVHKVWGRVPERNFSGVYNLKKLGFELEGIQKDHLQLNRIRQNSIMFGMLHKNWKKK